MPKKNEGVKKPDESTDVVIDDTPVDETIDEEVEDAEDEDATDITTFLDGIRPHPVVVVVALHGAQYDDQSGVEAVTSSLQSNGVNFHKVQAVPVEPVEIEG